jgi:YgiT-type zinc finger domain-containing protein
MIKKCNFCGSEQYEERRREYLYSREGKYLLVPNMPVEVCANCGMVYYSGPILEEVERHFFAIHGNVEKPDRYIEVPEKSFA